MNPCLIAWIAYHCYFLQVFPDIPIVKPAQARGIDVVSEVEVAYDYPLNRQL